MAQSKGSRTVEWAGFSILLETDPDDPELTPQPEQEGTEEPDEDEASFSAFDLFDGPGA